MTSDMEELVFLANAIRETRRRRLNIQLLLRNLVAWRRQVLNVVLLLLLLSQQNNITVPQSILFTVGSTEILTGGTRHEIPIQRQGSSLNKL